MTRLSPDEIRFFKKNGYLIKRRVMDVNLMARARERLWENAPPEVDCNNPDTWVGPIKRYSEEGTGNVGGEYSWKYKGIGGEDWIVRMLATDPSIWGMAEQLLGEGNLVVPERIRGIYCLLPEGNIPQRPVTCHTDAHPFHLGVVGYIDDVPPNGGGFWVWPKSHRTFYYDYHTQHGNERTEQYENHAAFFNQQPYVDCHGGAGGIIFAIRDVLENQWARRLLPIITVGKVHIHRQPYPIRGRNHHIFDETNPIFRSHGLASTSDLT